MTDDPQLTPMEANKPITQTGLIACGSTARRESEAFGTNCVKSSSSVDDAEIYQESIKWNEPANKQ